MHFVLHLRVQELWLENPDLRFRGGEKGQDIDVQLVQTKRKDRDGIGMDCIATCVREPPLDVRTEFDELALKPESALRFLGAETVDLREDRVIGKEGGLLDQLPQSFRDFERALHAELLDAAQKTVGIMRWRMNCKGPHNPFSLLGFFWSLKGQNWKSMPGTVESYGEVSSAITLRDDVQNEIQDLVADQVDEPIGHSLFREAWHQRFQNPRSAIVIGIAALEAGVKQFIGILVPEARWLLEKTQVPPVVSMLKNYLSTLPVRNMIQGEIRVPPKHVRRTLARGVELRNKIVHVGRESIPIPLGDVIELLLAIQDVLWLLDFYQGFSWALDYVRPDTLRAMDI